ncbi:MAG: galactose mutarotase [Spirochaetaceae bacterium]|jgi:aldose 1-epimerase|nr:galactose mutarotase [Spirochaetaceae bacterium]
MISRENFGELDGRRISLWTLDNGQMRFQATEYGAILTAIFLPDGAGGSIDITPGFSTLEDYVKRNSPFFGALVGRYANRVSNAGFTLNGINHKLDANDGPHTLHSGFQGYHQKIWQAEPFTTKDGDGIKFTRLSPSGEQGFPGNVELEVSYILNNKNEIILCYHAEAGAPTPINLTNHVYFNLKGQGSKEIAGHIARIPAARRLETDGDLIPTGRIIPVENTVFDFRAARALGENFNDGALNIMKGGYDVCYCYDPPENTGDGLTLMAEVREPESGRSVTCRSNQCCMQLYTGCSLNMKGGKNGAAYPKFSAFCLETQHYTNAPNIPAFPAQIIKPGSCYDAVTVYGFCW